MNLPFKCEMFSLFPFLHEHFHTGFYFDKNNLLLKMFSIKCPLIQVFVILYSTI